MTGLKPPPELVEDPERILAMGGPGVGKTSAWLAIAEKCPDNTFYVIDTDGAVRRMIAKKNLPNVIHRPADTWVDFVETTKEYDSKVKPGDWIVVDFFAPAWDAVQEWYGEQVFGKDLATYFLEKRKANAKGNPIDGDKDWPIIKKNFRAWVNMLKRSQANLFVTAPTKAVGERDDPQVRAMFGAYGVRPEGNKETGHWPHTVLWFQKSRVGEWQFTTVKDRERREVEKQPMANFVNSYLIPVAGWRPA